MTFQAGDAWGGDDVMLDDEGNPDIDEDELHSAASDKEGEEGGWDVSSDFFCVLLNSHSKRHLNIKSSSDIYEKGWIIFCAM